MWTVVPKMYRGISVDCCSDCGVTTYVLTGSRWRRTWMDNIREWTDVAAVQTLYLDDSYPHWIALVPVASIVSPVRPDRN